MTQPTRNSLDSVHLGFPLEDPEPVTGCDICAALVQQRTQARANRNESTAIDCNVEIRRHPHLLRRQGTS